MDTDSLKSKETTSGKELSNISPLLKAKDRVSLNNWIEKSIPDIQRLANNEPSRKISKGVKVPVLFEKTLFDPEDFNKLKKKPSIFYLDNILASKNELMVFESKQTLEKHLQETGQKTGDLTSTSRAPLPVYNIGHTFYEHANFMGASLKMSPLYLIPDLRKEVMYLIPIFDFSRFPPQIKLARIVSWNDQISSVKTGSHMLSFYENINYTGRTLYFAEHSNIPNLGSFWNDRISSINTALY